jgi:hypothetical protein
MGEIVNLRRARKHKTRTEAAELAAANRVQFGRSKAEKTLNTAVRRLADRGLDAHRLTHAEKTAGPHGEDEAGQR